MKPGRASPASVSVTNTTSILSSAPAVDPFQDYLVRSFDPVFEELGLRWLPWVGRGFVGSDSRTIVLGESIYVYESKTERAETKARIERRESLRNRHLAIGIKGNGNNIYVRNFERAVFMPGSPKLADRARLWSQVVYHNLVPALLEKRAHRPTVHDFTKGWREFLKLAEATGAARCVVYGTDWAKVQALLALLSPGQLLHKKRVPLISRSRPSAISIQLGDRRLDMLFIGHPSNHFSWKKWGAFMRDQGMTLAPQSLNDQLKAIYRENEALFKRVEDA